MVKNNPPSFNGNGEFMTVFRRIKLLKNNPNPKKTKEELSLGKRKLLSDFEARFIAVQLPQSFTCTLVKHA